MLPNGITVEVVRRTVDGVDAYGNAVREESEPVELAGCAYAPREGAEITAQGRLGVLVDGTLYVPPGADVQADDVIVMGGRRFEVDGDPAEWRSPYSGVVRGIAVQLRRMEG